MALPADFVSSLQFVHPRELLAMVAAKEFPGHPGPLSDVELTNEIRPVDLYCYLGARFGPPNGIQNFLRRDDSDNLIHWEWTLRHPAGIVSVLGMSFRTQVHLFGLADLGSADRDALVAQIKADFATNGHGMSKVRKSLEHWVELVNPYQRIRTAINKLKAELDELHLDPEVDKVAGWDPESPDLFKEQWKETAARYSRGLGLCFGIRSMLPVLAEAFVNLLLYVLLRPEIKSDQRLRDNLIRQPIDVRIKSLSINCIGFKEKPDYSSPACRSYHTLVNERNDLLHGNVVVDKLKFNDVHFHGTVPVFREYRSMWERSLGVQMEAVGLRNVRDELAIVEELIAYLLSCMEETCRQQIELIASRYELGLNSATQRVGILFPTWLVDLRLSAKAR